MIRYGAKSDLEQRLRVLLETHRFSAYLLQVLEEHMDWYSSTYDPCSLGVAYPWQRDKNPRPNVPITGFYRECFWHLCISCQFRKMDIESAHKVTAWPSTRPEPLGSHAPTAIQCT